MLPILSAFGSTTTAVKLLIVMVILSAAAAAGGVAGYKFGVASTVKEYTEKLDTLRDEKDRAVKEFGDYRESQEAKLRALETGSKILADALEAQQKAFRRQVQTVKTDYEKKLAERKEVPGVLSSAAVDSLNGVVDSMQKPLVKE